VCEADDANEGGAITFDFLVPVTFTSITLVDIDNNADVMLTLTDGSGLQRMYDVDANFTFDIAEEGSGGFETLDLATMSVQVGEGGGSATPSQDAGFNAADVWSLSVEFQGSGAIDIPISIAPAELGLSVFRILSGSDATAPSSG